MEMPKLSDTDLQNQAKDKAAEDLKNKQEQLVEGKDKVNDLKDQLASTKDPKEKE